MPCNVRRVLGYVLFFTILFLIGFGAFGLHAWLSVYPYEPKDTKPPAPPCDDDGSSCHMRHERQSMSVTRDMSFRDRVLVPKIIMGIFSFLLFVLCVTVIDRKFCCLPKHFHAKFKEWRARRAAEKKAREPKPHAEDGADQELLRVQTSHYYDESSSESEEYYSDDNQEADDDDETEHGDSEHAHPMVPNPLCGLAMPLLAVPAQRLP